MTLYVHTTHALNCSTAHLIARTSHLALYTKQIVPYTYIPYLPKNRCHFRLEMPIMIRFDSLMSDEGEIYR